VADPPFVLKDKEKLLVLRFRLEGPQLVDEVQAQALLAPYEGRSLTIADIYEAADRITTLYRNAGYVVAKAYVPAQNAKGGTLRIKIVPGKYGAVTLKNESLVRDRHMQGVLDAALKGETYIQKDRLERAMLLMSDLAGAGVPRIAIGPSRVPETSDFVFSVPEGRRLDGYLLGDNYGSPFTGRNRLSGGFNFNSPFGFGDRVSAYGIVSDDAKLQNGRIAYSSPIGYPRDHRQLRRYAVADRRDTIGHHRHGGLSRSGPAGDQPPWRQHGRRFRQGESAGGFDVWTVPSAVAHDHFPGAEEPVGQPGFQRAVRPHGVLGRAFLR
jgi:hemolysin activation/secretion protein